MAVALPALLTAGKPAGRSTGRASLIEKMYFTYILQSKKDNEFYTGITNNIEDRLKKHNHGYDATMSTKYRGPFKLVFVQICKDRVEARILEKYLKSGVGRELRDKLFKKNF